MQMPDEEKAGEKNESQDQGSEGEGGKEEESESFDREYVEKIRKEAAANRVRANAAEKELDALKTSQMSEQEKAIENAKREGLAEAEKLYKPLLAQERVKAQASGDFEDPDDAIRYLDLDKVDLDDKYAIGEALTQLLKDKPYLAAKNRMARPIDQGPQGKGVEVKTGDDWVRSVTGRR
jgi:hypothetical protein